MTIWLTSCATLPPGASASCPEWVHPSPPLVTPADDGFMRWAARHNRNYRCHCLNETAYCAE